VCILHSPLLRQLQHQQQVVLHLRQAQLPRLTLLLLLLLLLRIAARAYEARAEDCIAAWTARGLSQQADFCWQLIPCL
jgi:hypothetical protein